jgi:FlaA1/EpsC-like NDP-sugar epimerase
MADAIDLVCFAIHHGWGGEVILPVPPSYRLVDVATAIAPEAEHQIVGERPGEKVHELLFSDFDAPRTLRLNRYFVITPSNGRYTTADYAGSTGAQPVDASREYNSGNNDQWLSVADLRSLLQREAIHF